LLVKNLKAAIASHEAAMAKVTDTGTMWRRNAYHEMLRFIEEKRGKGGRGE